MKHAACMKHAAFSPDVQLVQRGAKRLTAEGIRCCKLGKHVGKCEAGPDMEAHVQSLYGEAASRAEEALLSSEHAISQLSKTARGSPSTMNFHVVKSSNASMTADLRHLWRSQVGRLPINTPHSAVKSFATF